jgi:hypothetical protein
VRSWGRFGKRVKSGHKADGWMAWARLVISPTMPRLALTDVLSAMAKGGHPVTPALVACLSPHIRGHIRRFGLSFSI